MKHKSVSPTVLSLPSILEKCPERRVFFSLYLVFDTRYTQILVVTVCSVCGITRVFLISKGKTRGAIAIDHVQ
jgi:hypothetical protein